MRKLMVIAALMCAAVSAQASAYLHFFVSDLNGPDDNPYSGDLTVSCVALGLNEVIEVSDGEGSLTAIEVAEYGVENTYIFSASQSYGGMKYTYTEEVVTDNMGVWCWGEGSWNADSGSNPVPEPTSGLLLLIGMAGLALKRKRA